MNAQKLKKVFLSIGGVGTVISLLLWWYPKKDDVLNGGVTTIDKTTLATQQDLKEVKAKLFGGSALRRLEPLETGKAPDQLPDDVYFFLSAHEIQWLTVESKSKYSTDAESAGYYGFDFEVQKFGGQLYLIGFISDEAFANVDDSNFTSVSYAVAPIAWDGGDNVVAIPFKAVEKMSYRYINVGVSKESAGTKIQIIDMVYKEAIQNPTVYSGLIKEAE